MKKIKNNSIDNLYKKSANETTPTALDNLILNQAKQSCQTQTTKLKPQRWVYSLATAAVFVMGITVIFNYQDQSFNMQVAPSYNKSNNQEAKKPKSKQSTIVTYSEPPLEPHPATKKVKKLTNRLEAKSGKLNLGQAVNKAKIELPAQTVSREKFNSEKRTNNAPETEALVPSQIGKLSSSQTAESELAAQPDNFFEELTTDTKSEEDTVSGLIDESTKLLITFEIKRLEKLMSNNDFSKAKQLITQLKLDYPNYDFSKLEKKLGNSIIINNKTTNYDN